MRIIGTFQEHLSRSLADSGLQRGRVILTFDDGANGEDAYHAYTHAMLENLAYFGREMGVLAYGTFFVNGVWVESGKFANIVAMQRAVREGHEIANHSYHHTLGRKWTAEQMMDDIDRTNDVIVAAGVPRPKFFRAPGGSVDWSAEEKATLTLVLAKLDMKNLDWDIDSGDWANVGHPQKIISGVISRVDFQNPRDQVILFHDGPPGNDRASSVLAVSAIISALIGAGWRRFEKASSVF